MKNVVTALCFLPAVAYVLALPYALHWIGQGFEWWRIGYGFEGVLGGFIVAAAMCDYGIFRLKNAK